MNTTVTTIIDAERCTGCGLCVKICPADTLSMLDGKAVVTGTESIQCGQCQAVCPADAVTVQANTPAATTLQTASVEDRWLPYGEADLGELVRLMRSRRSVRVYQDKPVARELLDDLVRIGITAPSGTNSQMWTFTVLPDRAAVEALGRHVAGFFRRLNRMSANPLLRNGLRLVGRRELHTYYHEYHDRVAEALREHEEGGRERLFHGAHAVIVVASKRGASCPSDDCHMAAQNMLLGAHAMGLGTCLIGFAVEAMKHDRTISRRIGIPASERVYSVLAIGHPAVRYQHFSHRRVPVVRTWTGD